MKKIISTSMFIILLLLTPPCDMFAAKVIEETGKAITQNPPAAPAITCCAAIVGIISGGIYIYDYFFGKRCSKC